MDENIRQAERRELIESIHRRIEEFLGSEPHVQTLISLDEALEEWVTDLE